MTETESRLVRRHRRHSDDGKGIRRLIAGKRFRVPVGTSPRESDQRFLLLEKLWQDNEVFCRRIKRDMAWTDIALWAANHICKGAVRIPLPPIDDILASYADCHWDERIDEVISRRTDETLRTHYTPGVDGLYWDEAREFFEVICDSFPSVNWVVPPVHFKPIVQFHEEQARENLNRLAIARNQVSPDPATPLIPGRFHEALIAYEQSRRKHFTQPDGSFNGSGHHMLGMIRLMRERMADFQLAELDFTKCQCLFDYWRDRPEGLVSEHKQPLSQKTCQNYLGELGRFLDWLHLCREFGWRKPVDFPSLNRKVRELSCDRRTLLTPEIETFSVDELTVLYKHASLLERFLLVWCINCAHGAAEMGRVEWQDVAFRTEHPWARQGLKIETSNEDSWCGFIRPKSGVIGWWLLWPETVQLLEWWRAEKTVKERQPLPTDRVLTTSEGQPLYRDESRNAQTGFSNTWTRLQKRIDNSEDKNRIRHRPFGTLRNQLPDWLGGEHAKAVVASVALCHGIPHQEDKLLYRHYANKPWGLLFQSQREFRQHLAPAFNSIAHPLVQ